MSFQHYESRPITRYAHQLTRDCPLDVMDAGRFRTFVDGEEVFFNAHYPPFPGDYIINAGDEDVYHCPQDVFEERNVT